LLRQDEAKEKAALQVELERAMNGGYAKALLARVVDRALGLFIV
jgi:hypothetical protein